MTNTNREIIEKANRSVEADGHHATVARLAAEQALLEQCSTRTP